MPGLDSEAGHLSWEPFQVCQANERPAPMRGIESKEGLGDRIRTAAFAEIQAMRAFRWAATHLPDATPELKRSWLALANEEEKHLGWLLNRLEEIGQRPEDRKVSLQLWDSFMKCETAKDFAFFMARAEERGRKAGFRFEEKLRSLDPTSAKIFGQIAKEEVAHIALAKKHYPEFEVLPN